MKKIVYICSGGGHLTEMKQLNTLFQHYPSVLITEKNKTSTPNNDIPTYYLLSGTRKHKVSYLFKFMINCIKSLYFFFRLNPSIIITTGAHTCVPMVMIASLFKRKVVFIESIARVHSKSLTGKIIEKKCDLIIVQWPSMLTVYSNAVYGGQLL